MIKVILTEGEKEFENVKPNDKYNIRKFIYEILLLYSKFLNNLLITSIIRVQNGCLQANIILIATFVFILLEFKRRLRDKSYHNLNAILH